MAGEAGLTQGGLVICRTSWVIAGWALGSSYVQCGDFQFSKTGQT